MSVLLRPALGAALFLLAPFAVHAQTAQPNPPAQAEPAAAPEVQDAARGKGRGGGRMKACRADVQTFCADAAKGGRRQCLEGNQAKLSPECQAALANNAGRGKGKGGPGREARGKGDGGGRREACRTDVQSLCGGVERGGGAIGQCLRANVAKLSPTCAEKVQAREAKSKT